jgi:PAS domain S-box-containing protein
LQDPLTKNNILIDQLKQKSVLLFIESNYTWLQGNWQWDMQSDAVFCSDVILSFSTNFNGTKSIIHPEDLEQVKNSITSLNKTNKIHLQFRIITTYGAIKTLDGQDVSFADHERDSFDIRYPETDLLAEENKRYILLKERAQWLLKAESFRHAERLAELGTWYINTATGETFYSDHVFRIYGIQPQSLNAHPHTFYGFIHLDDQSIIIESLEKAYKEKIPLDLEFRIVWADSKVRYVRQMAQWSFSTNGASILHGVLRDITGQKENEYMLEHVQNEFNFLETIHKLQEQDINTGYWYINLLIRKTVFSDNYYRLFGLKPHSIPSDFSFFLKYVHLDDQKIVEERIRQARRDHAPFEITYRIIRPDGKIRYIRQTGKVEIYAGSEMVLIGLVQDITQQKILGDKLYTYSEENAVQSIIQDHVEESADLGSMVWDLQSDKINWSKYLYKLLGLKPNSIIPSAKFILKFIHPDSVHIYNDELSLVMQGQEREAFTIKMLSRSETIQLKVKLTLITHEQKNFLAGVFRDITKDLKQDQQAREHIQLTEQLTENLPDRIMIMDSNYSFALWNKACEEKYKQKKDAVEGLNFFDIFPEYKTAETINHFNDVFRGKAVHLHHLPTPSREYEDWHMLPLKNNNDEVTGILHIIQDVTKDYKLKQQLNERLSFIETLVNSTLDRIIVLDKYMNYLFWNKKSEEYYGYKKEQVIGRNILEVFPTLINDLSYNEFRKAMQGEIVHIVEGGHSEHGYQYETYLIPVKGEKDEVIAILWMTHDFSKEYLLKSEQKIAPATPKHTPSS